MFEGPLSGVRILELCAYVSGPMATSMLADQGAEVIKIEAPGGDVYRQAGTSRAGWSSMFLALNRNKRSVVLDLKNADDRDALVELAGHCDVVVQNLKPGALDRLGLGSAQLREKYPRLIYASISGYGPTGPNADEGAFDPMIQAISGLTYMQRDMDSDRPMPLRTWVVDKLVAPMVAQAVSAALYRRERTGVGCAIDYVMLDATIWWLWPEGMMNQSFVGGGVKYDSDTSAVNLVSQTADGYMVVSPSNDSGWGAFADLVGKPGLKSDPRFDTFAKRMGNLGEFSSIVRASLGAKTTAEWCRLFKKAGIPAAPVLNIDQVLSHPQVIWNEVVQEIEHPEAGKYRSPRAPIRFDGERDVPFGQVPAPGQHTDEVLREFGIRSSRKTADRRKAI